MNIIFLDVDGVLNCMPFFYTKEHKEKQSKGIYDDIDESRIPLLKEICDKCNAKIVLSSTWKNLDDPEDKDTYEIYLYLVNMLKKYDLEIYDKTPDVPGATHSSEIFEWLRKREDRYEINFISIEDDCSYNSYEMYHMGDRLIQTKFYCAKYNEGGLQQKHVNLAIQKLLK